MGNENPGDILEHITRASADIDGIKDRLDSRHSERFEAAGCVGQRAIQAARQTRPRRAS
jgi:hypothetical protein